MRRRRNELRHRLQRRRDPIVEILYESSSRCEKCRARLDLREVR
jgi:hypothetical protein